MRTLSTTNQFERDLRRAKRRGKNLDTLWDIVEILQEGGRLAPRHRPHRLAGKWRSILECRIEGDWFLIWRESDEALTLVRTGTHADLFR